jgi:hypothetical protein
MATLFDPKTGQTVEYKTHELCAEPWETTWPSDDYQIAYLWFEGNFACDCNRSAFMYPDLDWDDHYRCGDTIQLQKLVRLDNGEEIKSVWEGMGIG